MKLTFTRQHKSIRSFPTTDTETDFVVITGINGSGKTHLLEAIEQGWIRVEGVPFGAANIRRFHHTNMQPEDTGVANPSELWQQRLGLWNEVKGTIFNLQQGIRGQLASRGISNNLTEDFGRVAMWTEKDILDVVTDQKEAAQIYQDLQSWLEDADKDVLSDWRQNIHRKGLAELFKEKSVHIVSLSEEKFRKLIPVDWNPTDVFQQNFAPLFVSYHRLRELNKFYEYLATQKGKPSVDNFSAQFATCPLPPPFRFSESEA